MHITVEHIGLVIYHHFDNFVTVDEVLDWLLAQSYKTKGNTWFQLTKLIVPDYSHRSISAHTVKCYYMCKRRRQDVKRVIENRRDVPAASCARFASPVNEPLQDKITNTIRREATFSLKGGGNDKPVGTENNAGSANDLRSSNDFILQDNGQSDDDSEPQGKEFDCNDDFSSASDGDPELPEEEFNFNEDFTSASEGEDQESEDEAESISFRIVFSDDEDGSEESGGPGDDCQGLHDSDKKETTTGSREKTPKESDLGDGIRISEQPQAEEEEPHGHQEEEFQSDGIPPQKSKLYF